MKILNNKIINILIIIILGINLITAQSEQFEFIVDEIFVEGNEILSDDDIIRTAKLFPGLKLNSELIEESIKRLWGINRFLDINIEALRIDEINQTISLLIIVKEASKIENIIFKGNNKKKNKKLMDELLIKVGDYLNLSKIHESAIKIEELYIKNKFLNVKIDYSFSRGSKDGIEVIFNITEGEKIKLKEIIIIGNQDIKNKNIIKQFKNLKTFKWFFPWRGKFTLENYEEDKIAIKNYYFSKGYKDFSIIQDTVIYPASSGRDLVIQLSIFEGEQYYFRNINWVGNTKYSNHDLNKVLDFHPGDLYVEEKFQQGIFERITSLYMDMGYFYFQINPEIIPVTEDSLDVIFNIAENNKVNIRKIIIEGNNKTEEKVIRRDLRVYPGEYFNRTKLLQSQRDIFMLNYFQNVLPDVVPVDESNIDLKIMVEEKQTGQANFSMGYNQFYGFTGGGGVEFPNFRGKGQTLSFSYQRGLSGNSSYNNQGYTQLNQDIASFQSVTLAFTEPWLFGSPNLFGFSISSTRKGQGQGNYLPFDIVSQGGTLKIGRRFKWPDYFFKGNWTLRAVKNKYLSNNINNLDEYFPLELIIGGSDDGYSFESSGISITQIINRDSRDRPEFPTNGSNITLTSTYSGGFLGGNEDYMKHDFSIQWFTPIINNFVLHQKIKTGSLKRIYEKSDVASIVPPNSKFIMGGSGIPYGEMLRGYPDNQIGPHTSSIYRSSGGNIILKFGFELRYLVSNNPTMYILGFAEAGNVWLDKYNLDIFDLKRSAGIGVRLFMPMLGMLGYDIGYGFDKFNIGFQEINGGFEHHFIFGMPF